MLRACILTVLISRCFQIDAQELNILLTEEFVSTAEAIVANGESAYVMGKTFDTTSNVTSLIGILYKLDISSGRLVERRLLNEKPINYDPRANSMFYSQDKIRYLSYGQELRDTIIENQNVYSYYHILEYDFVHDILESKKYPAFNEWGRQFVRHRDAFFTDSNIYVVNLTDDYEYSESNILITKLDYDGNVIWTSAYDSDRLLSPRDLLVDSFGNIVLCGTESYLSSDQREGYKYLFVYKIDSITGELKSEFFLEENTSSTTAIVEDPSGGYLLGSDRAEFREGGNYPAIPQIIKLNKSADSVLWRLPLSDSLSFALWHIDKIISIGNNEFIAIGVSDDYIPYSHVGRIVKFTGSGELIFDKELYNFNLTNGSEQRLTDIVPYNDGFLACGTIVSNADSTISPKQQGWVIHIDKNGENDLISTSSVSIVDTDYFEIFPMPANNILNLKFSSSEFKKAQYVLYEINGRKVQSGIVNIEEETCQIHLPQSYNGAYILNLKLGRMSFSRIVILN